MNIPLILQRNYKTTALNLLSFLDTPFQIQLCFHKVIENLEKVAEDPSAKDAARAQLLLKETAAYPEFRDGITDIAQIMENTELIGRLLADYFPPALTLNEIKAINLPYVNITFNHTQRFKNILQAAGTDFEINIRDFDQHQFYVLSCCIIMNEFYGTRLDFAKPLFYDIPDASGVTRHYRILYNADFLEIIPTEKSVPLTREDVDLLINNYDDLELWKEKFPEKSWILKGFTIMTLFDATVENAVSMFKEKLLGLSAAGFQQSIESIFRSIFRIPDIHIGFTVFNQEEDKFKMDAFGQQIRSFILHDDSQAGAGQLLCSPSYYRLIKEKTYFAVSDTDEYLAENPGSPLASGFIAQNIHSFIIAPVVKNKQLLGVLEVVSSRAKELNSINANKLEVVMPFLTDTVERLVAQFQNEVQAVIQHEYTAIHNSVYWKFRDEAQRLIGNRQLGKPYTLQEIVFPDVYPVYGQVDIKGSSDARNTGVQLDLQEQVKALSSLLDVLNSNKGIEPFAEEQQQLYDYLTELSMPVRASTEQYITSYIEEKIHPRLRQMTDPGLLPGISRYFVETNKETGAFHAGRKKFETTIAMINDKMAIIIDRRQPEAQALFPHYYERFKTDGVEHTLYIGASIAPARTFDIKKVHDLRLWQLQVLCEMETAHYYLKPSLPYPLEVTTLILVYHSTLAIRFRMDEKRFDVDGSYNARFEIIKKRIDKAHIKDTRDRITQAGKITIVYSNDSEELEYMQYIKTLQLTNLLGNEVEKFEVENLQGVTGLKAIRVKIIHP